MRTLLLGSGGREHALAWALSRSDTVGELFALPGNPGIGELCELLSGKAEDPSEVLAAVQRLGVELVVVGPEAPLVAGVADSLRQEGVAVFGPDAKAARLEGSKSFAKQVMDSAGVPTGEWERCDEVGDAIAALDRFGPPYVVKADGLAAGKGVAVTADRDQAIEAVRDRLERGVFGAAGSSVVIEEHLDGPEASLICFSDGEHVLPCEPAQDFKRALDDDAGPNTGGMGAYSPVPDCPPGVADGVVEEILQPMVRTLATMGCPFVGALYAGLALTAKGPKVVEFNARFGDPETQALIPRLTSDFGEVCLASATGELEGLKLDWTPDACVVVVIASGGYPGDHQTGFPIDGIEEAIAHGALVFHAGTALDNGRVVTAGGRVLTVAALDTSIAGARARAYAAAGEIRFEGRHMRSDIAARAEAVERRAL
ncbi:MAG TPA: phosphoribosylamine--glycine ligase [Actinomycetota bacterium]|nr:phosphoribosylamine--glycine ligase [Actinomycetota bacterium]